MKKAFTLAEIVIILVIVGIIAAITIPTLVVKYHKHIYYSQFMKSYNMLEEAYNMSVFKNGAAENWTWSSGTSDDFVKQYLVNFLKVSLSCNKNPETCGVKSSSVKRLYGKSDSNEFYNSIKDNPSFILQDGSLISIYRSTGSSYIEIKIDINGPKKSPNTWGRDIFKIRIHNHTRDGRYSIYPYELYNGSTHATLPTSTINTNCSTSTNKDSYCAAKLFLEGKMNY